MDETTKNICTFYERNIIGTIDQHDDVFNPDFDFSRGSRKGNNDPNVKQYKLFRAYINSQRIRGDISESTDSDRTHLRTSNHTIYDSSQNLNNFSIQNLQESASLITNDEVGSSDVDPIFERHSKMMQSIRDEPEVGPTPLATMYYNDPNYSDERIMGTKNLGSSNSTQPSNSQVNPNQMNNQPGARSGKC